MKLPYNRPWLIEISDHEQCPKSIRIGCQSILTFLWCNRILPVQFQAPYELASRVLEGVIGDIELEDEEFGNDDEEVTPSANGNGIASRNSKKAPVRIVDFCSGAGGPIRKIEKKINQKRHSNALSPIQFLLSDLHPPVDLWKRLYGSPLSPSSGASRRKTISYIAESVDATDTNNNVYMGDGILSERHLRTFFLSFHHFNEEAARSVLVDAMRNSDGICIFELQQCDLRSMAMIAMIAPLTWLIMPFTRPSLAILFFTYVIPIIPIILVIDGWISVYRTRPISHILRLTNLASLTLQLENQDGYYRNNINKGEASNQNIEDEEDGEEEFEWNWEFGKMKHTWPWGYMIYFIGRKKRIHYDDDEEEEQGEDGQGQGEESGLVNDQRENGEI